MTGVINSNEFSSILLNSVRFVSGDASSSDVGEVKGEKLMFSQGVQKTIQYVKQKTKTAEAAERAVRIFNRFVS